MAVYVGIMCKSPAETPHQVGNVWKSDYIGSIWKSVNTGTLQKYDYLVTIYRNLNL